MDAERDGGRAVSAASLTAVKIRQPSGTQHDCGNT